MPGYDSASLRIARGSSPALHADGGLELLNLHGKRRLRHVQLGRGAREAAGAGEREKGADVAQVVDHRACGSVIIFSNN